MPDSDKERESQRYNDRALALLKKSQLDNGIQDPSPVCMALQIPYDWFASVVGRKSPGQQGRVLEIGAGMGSLTGNLLATGAQICATDISAASLEVLQNKYNNPSNLTVKVADMESLPFEDSTFDLVTCAGSLSYGDNAVVMNEIYRVLKHGGTFIAVDSLNHNPIYRLNRWTQYLRGKRTLSTIKRMPVLTLLSAYEKKFGLMEDKYFGCITWAFPLLRKLIGESKLVEFSNWIDNLFNIKASAFKFVMVVSKKTD